MSQSNQIVELIGREVFQWLSSGVGAETTLKDIPDDILDYIASTDITVRNYAADRNTVIAIAMLTFLYKSAGKEQKAAFGGKDIALLKVLARKEKVRRGGKVSDISPMYGLPLAEIVTGYVGDRIREEAFINAPV